MAELYRRSNSPYWYAVLSDGRRLSTKCRSEREARKAASALQAEIDEQLRKAPIGLLWTEAVLLHAELAHQRDSTRAANVNLAGVITRELGDFDLAVLDHDMLRRFCQERRRQEFQGRKVSDPTIRKALSYMSSVYSTLIDHDVEKRPTENPLKTFDRSFLRSSKIVDRHLRTGQFLEALSSLSSDHHKAMLICLVATGMRESELCSLRWDEVDFDQNVIEIGNLGSHETKTSRSRRIPLLPPVAEALHTQKRTLLKHQRFAPKGFVFPNPRSTTDNQIAMQDFAYVRKRVQTKSGMKRFTIHGLRHTFASWALQQGIDDEAIRKALGHATKSTTSRYAHHIEDSELAQLRSLDLRLPAHFAAQTSAFQNPMDNEEGKKV